MIRRFFPFTIAQSAVVGYLLDDYAGGRAAFSFRKLASAYVGNCIKVRRSSDNTTLDVGFSGDYVDTSAITSFVGANNGFIDTWYDQSGNAFNISQSTLLSQPQIVSSGSLLTDSNGKLVASFDGTNDYLFTSSIAGFYNYDDVFFLNVYEKLYSGSGEKTLFAESSTSSNSPIYRPEYFRISTQNGSFIRNDANSAFLNETINSVNINTYYINNLSIDKPAGNFRFCKNGVLETDVSFSPTGSLTVNRLSLGALVRASVALYAQCNFQEFVFWNTDLYSDQENISNDVNNFYNHF